MEIQPKIQVLRGIYRGQKGEVIRMYPATTKDPKRFLVYLEGADFPLYIKASDTVSVPE